jgi:excisionase family DNA binding protein
MEAAYSTITPQSDSHKTALLGDPSHEPRRAAAEVAFPWLTKAEAATYGRVSERTLERAMSERAIRFGGGGHGVAVRIRIEWVDQWLEHRGRGGESR